MRDLRVWRLDWRLSAAAIHPDPVADNGLPNSAWPITSCDRLVSMQGGRSLAIEGHNSEFGSTLTPVGVDPGPGRDLAPGPTRYRALIGSWSFSLGSEPLWMHRQMNARQSDR